jgi:hypothetical protein
MWHVKNIFRSTIAVLTIVAITDSVMTASNERPEKETTRILWLGSSSTYYHDQPKHAAQWLSKYADMPSESYIAGKSGTAIYKYLQPDFKVQYGLEQGETVLDKIRTGRFAFVILQIPTDYLAGRGDNDRDAFVAGVETYVKAARRAGAQPIFYEQGWGDDELFITGDQLIFDLAVKYNMRVAPCRSAWKRIRAERPDIELHNLPDRTHPGTLGAYVNLCCFYATISDKSPVGLPVRKSTFWPHLTEADKKTARERLAGMTITDPYMVQLAGWMRTRSIASRTVELDKSLSTYFQKTAWETYQNYNKRIDKAREAPAR